MFYSVSEVRVDPMYSYELFQTSDFQMSDEDQVK